MKLCGVILEQNSVDSDLLEFIETDTYVYQSIVEDTATHLPSTSNPKAGTADISEFTGGSLKKVDDLLFGTKASITGTAETGDMDDLLSPTKKEDTKVRQKSHKKSSKKKVSSDTFSVDIFGDSM